MFGPNTHGVVHKILGSKATDKWSKNKTEQRCYGCGATGPDVKLRMYGGSKSDLYYTCKDCAEETRMDTGESFKVVKKGKPTERWEDLKHGKWDNYGK